LREAVIPDLLALRLSGDIRKLGLFNRFGLQGRHRPPSAPQDEGKGEDDNMSGYGQSLMRMLLCTINC